MGLDGGDPLSGATDQAYRYRWLERRATGHAGHARFDDRHRCAETTGTATLGALMNGVHDMGGMQNFGPVLPEPNEPRFHHDWERRVFGLTLAMGATGQWNLDQSRAARESLPAARYLASSYYQIWLEGLIKLMLERGFVTPAELADGQMREPSATVPGVLRAERVAAALSRGKSTERPLV